MLSDVKGLGEMNSPGIYIDAFHFGLK